MRIVREVTAYYPAFPLGGFPAPVECRLCIVEAGGRLYLRTPFAMLDARGEGDIELHMRPGRGFYASAAGCEAYLAAEYPHWRAAAPIMDAMAEGRHRHGNIVGDGRLCDRLGISPCTDELPLLARGHKRFPLKRVKAAVKAIS